MGALWFRFAYVSSVFRLWGGQESWYKEKAAILCSCTQRLVKTFFTPEAQSWEIINEFGWLEKAHNDSCYCSYRVIEIYPSRRSLHEKCGTCSLLETWKWFNCGECKRTNSRRKKKGNVMLKWRMTYLNAKFPNLLHQWWMIWFKKTLTQWLLKKENLKERWSHIQPVKIMVYTRTKDKKQVLCCKSCNQVFDSSHALSLHMNNDFSQRSHE